MKDVFFLDRCDKRLIKRLVRFGKHKRLGIKESTVTNLKSATGGLSFKIRQLESERKEMINKLNFYTNALLKIKEMEDNEYREILERRCLECGVPFKLGKGRR